MLLSPEPDTENGTEIYDEIVLNPFIDGGEPLKKKAYDDENLIVKNKKAPYLPIPLELISTDDPSYLRKAIFRGGDPQTFHRGKSLLMHASITGRTQIAKILIANGGCVRTIDSIENRNFTAMHYAVRHSRSEIVELLIDRGCSVDIVTPKGVTPLMVAALFGRTEMIVLLARRGTQTINRREESLGKTALHLATEHHHLETVKALLNLGAVKSVKDHNQKIPFDYVTGFPEMENLLRLPEPMMKSSALQKIWGLFGR